MDNTYTQNVTGCNPTEISQQRLEQRWYESLGQVNTRLFYADSIKKYRTVLTDLKQWASFSFYLRRYLYLLSTGRTKQDPPVAFDSPIAIKGRKPHFSPVRLSQDITDEELADYAAVLYAMTVQSKCLQTKKNGELSNDGLIKKSEYLKYLKGETEITSRSRLMILSVVLGFDPDDLEECANILGMMPYNWRSPEEVIFYYAHRQYAQSREFSMMQIQGLIRRYYEKVQSGAVRKTPAGRDLLTKDIQYGIDTILDPRRSFSSEEARRSTLLDFMAENQDYFTAEEHSQTVYRIFMELYAEARDETVKATTVPSGKIGTNMSAIQYRSFLHPDERANIHGIARVFDKSYAVCSPQRLADDASPVYDTLRSGRLSAERIEKILNKEISATKKDIVFLFFYIQARRVDVMHMSQREHRSFMDSFQRDLDNLLIDAGLPPLYAANPFDNLILTALASANPYLFFEDNFRDFNKMELDEDDHPWIDQQDREE